MTPTRCRTRLGLDPGPRLRRLAADGQAQGRPGGRQGTRTRPSKLFQQGKLDEAENGRSPGSPRTARARTGARRPSTTSPRASTSARNTSRPTTASSSSSPTTRRPSTWTSWSAANTRWRSSGWPRAIPRPSPRRSSPGTRGSPASSPSSTPRGTGLKALEHVRSHDPDGPLADDAVLQIADFSHEQQRLRVGRDLLRPVRLDLRRRARSCRKPSSPRSTPG